MIGLLAQLGKVPRSNLSPAWLMIKRTVNIDAERLPCELKEETAPKKGPKKITLGRILIIWFGDLRQHNLKENWKSIGF